MTTTPIQNNFIKNRSKKETINSKNDYSIKNFILFISIQLLCLVNEISNFKMTILQNTTVTLNCGTGGGIALGGWIKPLSESINYAVDEGTRTGDSLNMYKEATPAFGSALTKKVGSQWVFTAMHWDSSCVSQGFYRINNADLITISSGTSLKFSTVMSLQGTVASSFNLVDATSTINPALRNDNFLYGPVFILEFQALTPPNTDNVVHELAFGPSFMHSIDFLWKYDQFQDFEDQTAFKARIYDGTVEKSYMEDGNFNSFGVLVKPNEFMRVIDYNSSVYDIRNYFRIDVTDFPNSVPLTKPVGENITDSDGDIELIYHPLPDNLVYLSKYLFSPQTMHSRLSSKTRLYSPVDQDNPYISMHMIAKFWHGHEDNTLSFNLYQGDDDRNSLTFDLVFSTGANTITFTPSGSFASDGAHATFNSFTVGDGFKEYVLSMAVLNATTNHTVSDTAQKKVYFKLTLSDQKQTGSTTWYATVERFQLIEGKGFIYEIKNSLGTEVSFSELRFGDGGIDYEIMESSTTADEQFYNLEDTTKYAVMCPDTSYLDLTTYQCAASCNAAFSQCYSQNEGIKCAGGQFLNLVGRQCSATCDTSGKFFIQTVTTQTNECTQCLDRYCEVCPSTTYNCETYKKGIIVEPKYVYFNYSNTSLIMRFEKLVNFSRLGEYTNTSFVKYETPGDYELISNNKTGNFDIISYMQINKTINESNLNIQFTRVVNWNYGDPDTFYTIDNITHILVTGWYNSTAWSGFANFTGRFIANSAKVLAVGGALFDPTGLTKLLKLWSYTQFLFYLNIELPLFVKSFIYNFRWSIFSWLPNWFKDTEYYCFIYTFKFEQNSLDCSLWRNLAYNIDLWALLLFYKLVVASVAHGFNDRKNWYIVKFKRANERLNGEFLWRLIDAQLIECVLYLFLYFKIFKFEHPGRADHIAGYIFGGIYLLMMVWTTIILILFLRRLTPKKLTEDEAMEKAHHVIDEGENKDGKEPTKKELILKDVERGWVNYGRWNFLVKEYLPKKSMRAFPIYEFWKHILFVSLVFWLHDYPIWQVSSVILIQLGYTICYLIFRPAKTKKVNIREITHLIPLTTAYSFTFFSLYRELSILRWGTVFRYYLVGFGVVISLWCIWILVITRVFFYTFTGMWEWGNKITEKCRGAEATTIVFQKKTEDFEGRKVEVIPKPEEPPKEEKDKKKKKKKEPESETESEEESPKRKKKKKRKSTVTEKTVVVQQQPPAPIQNPAQPQIIFLGANGLPLGGGNGNGNGNVSNKEAYNDGYLAGLKEATKLKDDRPRRGKSRPRSRGSEYSDINPPSDFGDEEFRGGVRSYKQPRSVKRDPIPMRKGRSRSRIGLSLNNEKENLLESVTRNRHRQLPKIENPIPDKIFDTENKGTNAKFFDKSKVQPINNFRTKDGKNFDEEVELRRKRYVRNKNNGEGNDEL